MSYIKKNLNFKKKLKLNNNIYISFQLNTLLTLKSYIENKIPQSEIINYSGLTYININYLKNNEVELSN
tara:strand:+ start:453 stop:659 length:207 start_codon:yes stop_codon:yes gene_type:complete